MCVCSFVFCSFVWGSTWFNNTEGKIAWNDEWWRAYFLGCWNHQPVSALCCLWTFESCTVEGSQICWLTPRLKIRVLRSDFHAVLSDILFRWDWHVEIYMTSPSEVSEKLSGLQRKDVNMSALGLEPTGLSIIQQSHELDSRWFKMVQGSTNRSHWTEALRWRSEPVRAMQPGSRLRKVCGDFCLGISDSKKEQN